MNRLLSASSLLFAMAGCGGAIAPADGAAADAGSSADGGGNSDVSSGPDAGWTRCSSPDNYAICHGPTACPVQGPTCPVCQSDSVNRPSTDVSLCLNDALVGFGFKECSFSCSDGSVCVQGIAGAPVVTECAPYNVGVLLANNSAADRVHYADFSAWTGDALPQPDVCPTLDGVRACGANCGGCLQGELCTGRSPTHPYGFCVPDPHEVCAKNRPKCPVGKGCFLYTVQSEAQLFADENGACLPIALCQKAATSLPGGGSCVGP